MVGQVRGSSIENIRQVIVARPSQQKAERGTILFGGGSTKTPKFISAAKFNMNVRFIAPSLIGQIVNTHSQSWQIDCQKCCRLEGRCSKHALVHIM